MSYRELNTLYREHGHITELLDVLERQFDSLDHGGAPDWRILADILEYLVEHPDSDHDRFETQLLQRLARRAPSYDDVADALLAQHRQLMDEGLQLRRLIDGVLTGQVVPRSRLARLGDDFIRDYRLLIERENSELFPALARHLRPNDWLELVTDRYWCSASGPGLEPGHDTEYETLCRCIIRQAGDRWPPVADPAHCPVCDNA